MIPEWEKALYSAKSLMSNEGRVLVGDFDTYTEKGNHFKDFLIHTWYKQDGVRIEVARIGVVATKGRAVCGTRGSVVHPRGLPVAWQVVAVAERRGQ